MADRRDDSSMRPPDNDNPGPTEEQLLEQMREMRKKSAQSNQAHENFVREHREADEKLQARMAKNRPPPASGWGSMSNPETTSASDRTNEAAGQDAHNQDSRFEREARSPPSRDRRKDAERGSREYDERSQWSSRRSGEHPPRTLAMPHAGSDQDGTGQRRWPLYDSSGQFMMYDRPVIPSGRVHNTSRQSEEALMQSIEAMQRRGIPTPRMYPHESGYMRQGGPCSESASLAAPPQWRGEGGAPMHDMSRPPENPLADELAAANAKWQRLDGFATMDWMVDPDIKPQFVAGSEGMALIEEQYLFTSPTLKDEIIFVGTKGRGRWAHSKESVTVSVSNKQNKTHYTRSEVRESIAAEIKSLAGFDDKCIDEDLRPNPWGRQAPGKCCSPRLRPRQ